VLQGLNHLKKGKVLCKKVKFMQKSKILQTFSVIGLTAFCSIQSAEAWNKKVEFEIGPLPENQQAMSCTGLAQIMLEWGGGAAGCDRERRLYAVGIGC
jgi:hypothetical protein